MFISISPNFYIDGSFYFFGRVLALRMPHAEHSASILNHLYSV
ncbi:MAG: hypothetical protein RML94_05655 [Bacteroidia bacterium]|nr:hypothetical protein [Bacteroidia bacterium]